MFLTYKDEITNLGCVVVFHEILENAGLITLSHKHNNGKENLKLFIENLVGSTDKWLYRIGDRLTHT